MVISLPSFGFCRTHVVSKGLLRAGCFQALRRVEKPEDQGQFCRYALVQYLSAALRGSKLELFPLGKCDEDGRPGTGSRLYYISSRAMCWPTYQPKKPVTG
jgi:hypothetical protein